jgi:hypothetical protein
MADFLIIGESKREMGDVWRDVVYRLVEVIAKSEASE